MHMNEAAKSDHSVIAACINKRQLTLGRAAGAVVMPGRSILIRPPKERTTQGGQRGVSLRRGMLPSAGGCCGSALYAAAGRGAIAWNEGVETSLGPRQHLHTYY